MIFSMALCSGCRTCEMACSFGHTGEFVQSRSSIKILEKNNGPGFEVMLVEDTNGRNFGCNGCKGRETPLCVQYCNESEELGKILKQFLDMVSSKHYKK